jgi:hypothetical protein
MALTRPRAYQIFDLDYKQAVRVVALTNVVLSGGAPNAVDGVNLSLNDRILVIGQTNPIQNGIYYVTALGTGANGTWARSIDSDTTGELEGGTVIMVTEGSTYADTQWKLTTDDPIIIGTTALTFVQNYLANSISYGQTSFAIAAANANATISVAGTSNVAVFATTGAFLTGVVSATGNVNTSAGVSATGNVRGGNILTPGLISATGAITGAAISGTTISGSGNVTGANIVTGGLITATGNVTGANITTTGIANVATLEVTTLANVKATTAATSTTTGAIRTAGGIGVAGNAHIGGALVATTKSFAIQHPDKQDKILFHGCLEGPEHAVYTRGRCTTDTIDLPDYWKNLVDSDSITVHLTPVNYCDSVKVVAVTESQIKVRGKPTVDCFYIIHARRKDVPPLALEVPGLVEYLYRNRNL